MKTGPDTPSGLQGNSNHNESLYFIPYYAAISSAPTTSGSTGWSQEVEEPSHCEWMCAIEPPSSCDPGMSGPSPRGPTVRRSWLRLLRCGGSAAHHQAGCCGGKRSDSPPHRDTVSQFLSPPPQQRPAPLPQSDVIKNELTRRKT